MTPGLLGCLVATITLLVDQGHKHWMIYVYDIAARDPVRVGPFLDLVMAWNPGISYSLLSAETPEGRWGLLALALAATLLLGIWMWRATQRLTGLGLGLIVGGALGNAFDRYAHGAVADFFLLHIETETWGRLNWYVFNIADVAIVAGVAVLLYESFFVGPGDPSPEKAAS
jgi:signal peptidase II